MRRSERLLAVKHFHVVFTLPSELRDLAKANPREVFNTLLHAASETLLELGHSRLQAILGFTDGAPHLDALNSSSTRTCMAWSRPEAYESRAPNGRQRAKGICSPLR